MSDPLQIVPSITQTEVDHIDITGKMDRHHPGVAFDSPWSDAVVSAPDNQYVPEPDHFEGTGFTFEQVEAHAVRGLFWLQIALLVEHGGIYGKKGQPEDRPANQKNSP